MAYRVLLAVLLVGSASSAAAVQSAVQESRDKSHNLIVKDVGAEHWAITWDRITGTVSGIVLGRDGAPSRFVDCSVTGQTLSDVSLSCFGASACPASPCPSGAWTFIAPVTLPRAFFLPDGAPPPDVVRPTCRDFSGDWWISVYGECHNRFFAAAPLAQTNCTVTSGGYLSGSVAGAVMSFQLEIGIGDPRGSGCMLSASGTAVSSGDGFAGIYQGRTDGRCCAGQLVTGALAAARRN